MTDGLREGARALADLLLPAACAGCGVGLEGPAALCAPCARSLPAEGEAGPPPVPLEAWVAGAAYQGPAQRWIRRFKYPGAGTRALDPAAEAVCCDLLRCAADRAPGPRPAWVVPVPHHPRRQQARGFNPAARLARALAREQRLALAADALVRLRPTPSQTGLSRAARRRNVAGAFAARRALGGRVWLVDDVVTTGSTLAEAARALRLGGAGAVVAVCAARRGLLPR